jgi:hypothetical protein
MTVSVKHVTRTLIGEEGLPRVAVLVKIIRELDDRDMWEGSTDKFGKFDIDTSTFTDDTYRLEYYGDGIVATVFATDGTTVLAEDPLTPWEYDVELFNPTAITRSAKIFNFLVFKDSGFYGEDYDI